MCCIQSEGLCKYNGLEGSTIWVFPQLLLKWSKLFNVGLFLGLLPFRSLCKHYRVEDRWERKRFLCPIFADAETFMLIMVEGS